MQNITIDDFVPVGNKSGHPIYSKVYGRTIVLPLIEKAFAKILNGYHNFRGNHYDFPTAFLFNGKLINAWQNKAFLKWKDFETKCMVMSTPEFGDLKGLSNHHGYAKVSANATTNRIKIFNGNTVGGRYFNSTFYDAHIFDMPFEEMNNVFADILIINFYKIVRPRIVNQSIKNSLASTLYCLIAKAKRGEYIAPFSEKKLCIEITTKSFCMDAKKWNIVLPIKITPNETIKITNEIAPQEFIWSECFYLNKI